ncbi:MAG TPA: dihydrolipoamide acetyltransferase family protein [Candidatus Binatia bacterium]|nr:dihydrolipoamide acetyltransferase family protein [Candidatus Binatia bacterium]
MSRPFALPDLGEGLTEAEIVKVLVNEGDVLAEDAPLLEVETDKATVEIPSPFAGRVARVHVQPGQTVKVGDVLVTFDDAGAQAASGKGGGGAGGRPALRSPAPLPRRESELRPVGVSQASTGSAASPSTRGDGPVPVQARAPADASKGSVAATASGVRVGPVPATPATRRLARELGVDLASVRGTGPGGRVTDDDVRAAGGGTRSSAPPVVEERQASGRAPVAKPLAPVGVEPPALPRFEQWGPVERQPLSHLRRTIAERMTLSAMLIPHVTHFDRADVTELDAIIRRNVEPARERGLTLTLTSFLLKAAALALREHPQFNASLDPAAGELILKRYHHLGVAVATERGLIVPVIRDVDRKPLVELQRELAALALRVRDGKATLDDLRGGTFTITNIGALGGTGAIPIINYPEVAILGVARAREEPVVHEGQIVPRTLLPISLTFDHRVADGADGARFAAAIVRRLERPEQLLLEW